MNTIYWNTGNTESDKPATTTIAKLQLHTTSDHATETQIFNEPNDRQLAHSIDGATQPTTTQIRHLPPLATNPASSASCKEEKSETEKREGRVGFKSMPILRQLDWKLSILKTRIK